MTGLTSQKSVNLSSGSRPLVSSSRKSLLINFLKPQSFPWTKRYALWLSAKENTRTNKEEQDYFGDFHNVIKLCVCEFVCERESLLWVMAISSGGTMAKEAGCRKYCLQGAFNTSEENRISLSIPLSLSVSSRCHIKTSGKHETELLCLFGQEVRNCRDQSSPIIMCLWSANYLWQWQEGFCNTQSHYKDTAKVLEFLCVCVQ